MTNDLLKNTALKTVKNSASFIFASFVSLTLLATIFSFSSIPVTDRLQLKIDSSSVLYLKGSSNVNSFQCNCTEPFSNYNIEYRTMKDARTIRFSEAQIKIPTKKLDCRNKAINKDLFEALRADDFSYITINIHEAYQLDACYLFESCDEWTNISVDASIKITDVCQNVNFDVQAMKVGEDRYRLMTSHTLSMYDFNIDPPKALMGLVKVNPRITIYVDFTLEVLSSIE